MTPDLIAQSEARIGKVLRGKYTLEKLVGTGGMASVYAAQHRNSKRVAVKILHASVAVDGGLRERFLKEGYAANRVGHPGAVEVLDDDVDENGLVFVVMELLEGESLSERANKLGGKLPVSEAIDAAEQVLDVLQAAHAAGIVHRDIKPDNIFRLKDGRIKVLDFGIARVADGSTQASATVTGGLMGTPAFMAPEQAMGQRNLIGPATDQYSVGATLFKLLTGRFVQAEAETPEAMVIYTATRPAPRIETFAPELPAKLAQCINRSLTLNPADRWPSALDMKVALAQSGYLGSSAFEHTHVALSGPSREPVQRASAGGAAPPAPTAAMQSVAPAPALSQGAPLRPLATGVGVAHTVVGSPRARAKWPVLVLAPAIVIASLGIAWRIKVSHASKATVASSEIVAPPRPPPNVGTSMAPAVPMASVTADRGVVEAIVGSSSAAPVAASARPADARRPKPPIPAKEQSGPPPKRPVLPAPTAGPTGFEGQN